MSRIRAKHTKPEMAVRRLLWSMGYRYRLHAEDLPGKPDIVLRSRRLAIFINGCFWHQHKGCKRAYIPSSRTEYWVQKLQKNVERDQRRIEELKAAGWRAVTVWECELSNTRELKAKLISSFSGT